MINKLFIGNLKKIFISSIHYNYYW